MTTRRPAECDNGCGYLPAAAAAEAAAGAAEREGRRRPQVAPARRSRRRRLVESFLRRRRAEFFAAAGPSSSAAAVADRPSFAWQAQNCHFCAKFLPGTKSWQTCQDTAGAACALAASTASARCCTVPPARGSASFARAGGREPAPTARTRRSGSAAGRRSPRTREPALVRRALDADTRTAARSATTASPPVAAAAAAACAGGPSRGGGRGGRGGGRAARRGARRTPKARWRPSWSDGRTGAATTSKASSATATTTSTRATAAATTRRSAAGCPTTVHGRRLGLGPPPTPAKPSLPRPSSAVVRTGVGREACEADQPHPRASGPAMSADAITPLLPQLFAQLSSYLVVLESAPAPTTPPRCARR